MDATPNDQSPQDRRDHYKESKQMQRMKTAAEARSQPPGYQGFGLGMTRGEQHRIGFASAGGERMERMVWSPCFARCSLRKKHRH